MALKIPLTVNVVVHRANIDRIEAMVALALALGASRVEIAHVQCYGWALRNRTALMPSAEQVKRAAQYTTTLLILLPSCIRSNPLLISGSGMV